MLEKVWRKGNPLTLLVRMQTSTVTMKNMWRFLKKLEKELPYGFFTTEPPAKPPPTSLEVIGADANTEGPIMRVKRVNQGRRVRRA